MNYEYERPLKKSEVFVALVRETSFPVYEKLGELIQEASEKYSFSFRFFDSLESCLKGFPEKDYVLSHVIVVTDRDTLKESSQFYLPLLKKFKSMSLAPIYSSLQKFNEEGKNIETLKKAFQGKINFLRPNSTDKEEKIYASLQKIIDNSVCDTVRIKYRVEKVERDISALTQDFSTFFRCASEIYERLALYHRAPSDGFFAIRVPDGFLITATKTNKISIDCQRISLVYGYDKGSNLIKYSGKYLPSSDVVEASIVFANCPEVHSLIHSHASDRFTRNPEFAHKIAVPQMSYGEAELGFALAKEVPKHLDDFIIMEDHGELFAFREYSDLSKPARLVESLCSASLV